MDNDDNYNNDDGGYSISSPCEPNGSGELKIEKRDTRSEGAPHSVKRMSIR